MLSSVFWNTSAHLSDYIISTFLDLKHIQNITTVKQIFQICPNDMYLLVLVFKRASNWQHIDLQVVV